jgi:hypothetical protein
VISQAIVSGDRDPRWPILRRMIIIIKNIKILKVRIVFKDFCRSQGVWRNIISKITAKRIKIRDCEPKAIN